MRTISTLPGSSSLLSSPARSSCIACVSGPPDQTAIARIVIAATAPEPPSATGVGHRGGGERRADGGELVTAAVARGERHRCLQISLICTRTCSTFQICPHHRRCRLAVMLILILLVTVIWHRVTMACTAATMSVTMGHRWTMTWAIFRLNLRQRQRQRQLRRATGAEELL